MKPILYTAEGCVKCRIVKTFLVQRSIPIEQVDIKESGPTSFKHFYAANRERLAREPEGIALPVFYDGEVVRQGVGAIIGYLQARDNLDGFLRRCELSREWIRGIDLSSGNPDYTEDLLLVLRHFRHVGLKVHLAAEAGDAGLLAAVTREALAQRLTLAVAAPSELYGWLAGSQVPPEVLARSLECAISVRQYRLFTQLRPFFRRSAGVTPDYLTPAEVGQTAATIASVTGSKKHPYFIVPCDPAILENEHLRRHPALTQIQLFKYRTEARRYQVFAEIRDLSWVCEFKE